MKQFILIKIKILLNDIWGKKKENDVDKWTSLEFREKIKENPKPIRFKEMARGRI